MRRTPPSSPSRACSSRSITPSSTNHLFIPEAAHEHYLLADVAAYAMAWNTKQHVRRQAAGRLGGVLRPGGEARAAQPVEISRPDARGGGDGRRPGRARSSTRSTSIGAFAKLDADEEHSHLVDLGAQGAQLIIDGETDVGTFGTAASTSREGGAPVNYTFDNASTSATIVVPKGAKNKAEAMSFIANFTDPKNQAVFCKSIPYGPVNPATFALLERKPRQPCPTRREQRQGGVSEFRLLGRQWRGDHRALQQMVARMIG